MAMVRLWQHDRELACEGHDPLPPRQVVAFALGESRSRFSDEWLRNAGRCSGSCFGPSFEHQEGQGDS